MATSPNKDELPVLTDVVRPGQGQRPVGDRAADMELTAAEVEAIAARVTERYTAALEQAITRALRSALEHKQARRRGRGS